MAAIRQRVLENPALLQPAIQMLAQNNPQLATALNENPEILLQLLGAAGGGGDEYDDDDEAALGAGGVQTLSLTPEEHQAIQRVGRHSYFSVREGCAEAYHTVTSPWLYSAASCRSIFCLWQERGTSCQLFVRRRF
jgi:UV excision repair protein RAD23